MMRELLLFIKKKYPEKECLVISLYPTGDVLQ